MNATAPLRALPLLPAVACLLLLSAGRPAEAATIYAATVHGSGPSPLGQAIGLTLDGQEFVAFGIDVMKPLMFGGYEAEIFGVETVANGGRAAWIYENFGSAPADGLAVQLALWDVLNDGANGLGAGFVQVGAQVELAATKSLAESIIAESLGQSSSNAMIVRLTSLAGVAWQPLITSPLPPPVLIEPPPSSAAPTPEPATWLMLAAGLALGRCYTRRK